MRPVECACGFKYRVTREWIRRMAHEPVCPICAQAMAFPCVEDAFVAGEAIGLAHPGHAALEEAWARQTLRLARGAAPDRMRCGGCRRFVGAANEACGCGFVNDIRGRRNHGRWADGGVVRDTGGRDEWPF